MKKLFLAILLIACSSAYADPWIIDDKTREDCAKKGGCILTVPDGLLISTKDVNQMIIEMQKQAFEAGLEQGKAAQKTCTGKDV